MATSLADEFFTEREVVPPSVDALWRARTAILKALPTWAGTDRLPGRPKERLRPFFRGQVDSTWALSSSLYRVARAEGAVTEDKLYKAESAVLRAMRAEGLGHQMTDGELLMVLQHHSIPTRLVDVSRTPRPALYFATEGDDSKDGRLFVIGLRVDANGNHATLQLTDKKLPWAGAAIGREYSSNAWSQTLASVEEATLDPRMRAQDGRFLVGGLLRRYAGENLTIGGVLQPAEIWPDLSTLRVFFPLRGATKPLSARWPAVGWTIRIPAEWKGELRTRLAKQRFTRDHMYPDFDGSRRLGARIAAEAVMPPLRRLLRNEG